MPIAGPPTAATTGFAIHGSTSNSGLAGDAPGPGGSQLATTVAERDEARAELLPATLEEALAALRDDACLAEGFGGNFIDYYLRIKEAELARYHAEVTEWEQREYFELF